MQAFPMFQARLWLECVCLALYTVPNWQTGRRRGGYDVLTGYECSGENTLSPKWTALYIHVHVHMHVTIRTGLYTHVCVGATNVRV